MPSPQGMPAASVQEQQADQNNLHTAFVNLHNLVATKDGGHGVCVDQA